MHIEHDLDIKSLYQYSLHSTIKEAQTMQSYRKLILTAAPIRSKTIDGIKYLQ